MAARNTWRHRIVLHRSLPVVGMVARFYKRMPVAGVWDYHTPVRVRVRRRLLRGSELHTRQEVVA